MEMYDAIPVWVPTVLVLGDPWARGPRARGPRARGLIPRLNLITNLMPRPTTGQKVLSEETSYYLILERGLRLAGNEDILNKDETT